MTINTLSFRSQQGNHHLWSDPENLFVWKNRLHSWVTHRTGVLHSGEIHPSCKDNRNKCYDYGSFITFTPCNDSLLAETFYFYLLFILVNPYNLLSHKFSFKRDRTEVVQSWRSLKPVSSWFLPPISTFRLLFLILRLGWKFKWSPIVQFTRLKLWLLHKLSIKLTRSRDL